MTDDEQVLAILESFTVSWKSLDGAAVAECLENSALTTVIGTDPGEYIVGRDAYRSGWERGAYPTSVAAFDWAEEPVVVVEGTVAWAHGVVSYDMVVPDQSRVTGRMWISTTLRRKATWRIVHLHASYADQPVRSPTV